MAKAYRWTLPDGFYAGEVEDFGLLPANGTHTAPALRPGFIPRWTGAAWEQIENHKGAEGYLDGQPHTIKDYGPPPAGWSDSPPPPEPPGMEERIQVFMSAIQNRLDSFARTRAYDGVLSAASYATSANETFRAEGQYMVDARDATWEWCNAFLNQVLIGRQPIPAWEAFEAELDAAVPLVWPVPDTRVSILGG